MSRPIFCTLPDAGLIRFDGADAQAFLRNLLTCDVAALAPDRSTYGGYCTPKGRLLATFLLWRSADGYFMQLPASLRESIQKQLSRFILRSKVKAVDATGGHAVIGVAGDGSAELVRRATGQAPAPHAVAHAHEATVIGLASDRFQIVVARDAAQRVLDAMSPDANRADPGYWEWLDIRAGVPWITPETQEAFVPQMVNLDLIGGVSFEKGCYPGQEIVARMHYRGTLKQRMYLGHVAGTEKPRPGDKLYGAGFGEQASGTIVSAAQSPAGGFDALAVMQIASAGGAVRWNPPMGAAFEALPLPYPIPA